VTQVTNEPTGTTAPDGADTDAMVDTDTDTDVTTTAAAAAGCPFPHHLAAALPVGCPVRHDGTPIERTKADLVVRKILRIHERPEGVTSAQAYSTFQRSMLISAIRCTLTYVVFPFVLPAVGFATGVGPILGIIIGTVAITCDVYTIRRFFAVDHKYRWHFSAIAFAVICLLATLLVQDVVHLLT
jgi:hypothetical protein